MKESEFPSEPVRAVPLQPEPIIVSYIRFSTPEQAEGYSEARQNRQAEEWAKAKCLELTQYADRGVSGYTGKNRRKGALSILLREIKTGKIPAGSYLVVENLDRLSREHPLDSMDLIRDILAAGITIAIPGTGQEFTDESVRRNPWQYQSLSFDLGRASGESARKSDLLNKSWRNKREAAIASGKPIGANCRAWLKLVDGNYVVQEDRAKIIRQIFEWSIAGFGQHLIAKKLNEAGVERFGEAVGKTGERKGKIIRATCWDSSYVQKILHDRTVIGDYQPCKLVKEKDKTKRTPLGDPIPGYYPAIIDLETFQNARNGRKKTSGNLRERVSNLFTSLIFDAETGNLCHCHSVIRKSGKQAGQHAHYLVSSAAQANRWPYEQAEYAILTTLAEIDWREISGEGRPAEEKAMAEKVAALEIDEQRLSSRCANLAESIAFKPLRTLVDQLEKAELDSLNAAKKLAAARRELSSFQLSKIDVDDLKIPKEAFDPLERELRLSLRAEIGRRVKRIELQPRDRKRRFAIAVQFVNGVFRWIRVTPQYGKPPVISAVAFQKPENARDILTLPSLPEDNATGD